MIHIIVVTHGNFGEGLLNSIEMVMGKREKLDVVAMKEGNEPSQMAKRIAGSIDDGDDGTLILADLFGGSPCNSAAMLLKDPKIELVTGVNLPMLIQVLEAREHMELKELKKMAIETAKAAVIDVRTHLLGK